MHGGGDVCVCMAEKGREYNYNADSVCFEFYVHESYLCFQGRRWKHDVHGNSQWEHSEARLAQQVHIAHLPHEPPLECLLPSTLP